MEPCNALVLLGYSNTGKDTIAALLSSRFTGVTNAKFSALTKQILADVCGVPVSMMEDRQWRENTRLYVNGVQTTLTPFDLLTALYHGAPGTNLASANAEWTLKSIGDSFPVFTDVRRVAEFNCVTAHYNPLVIFLTRDDAEPGVNDKEIAEVFYAATDNNSIKTNVIHIATGEQPEQTFERVLKELKANNRTVNYKPTLHIYLAQKFPVAVNHLVRGRVPSYEPLNKFAVDLANLTMAHGICRYGFNKMFDAATSEMNWSNVELPTIETDAAMAWHTSHENILEQLRSMANLKVTVLDDSMLGYAYETFQRTEILV